MLSRIKKIATFGNVVRGLVYLITVIPGVATLIVSMLSSIPILYAIPLVTFTTTIGLAGGYYGLRLYDYFAMQYGLRNEGNHVADVLQEMLDTGHNVVQLGMVADIWAGEDKDKPWIWNPKLRRVKDAVNSGKVIAVNQPGVPASRDSAVSTEDLVEFFRTRG